MTNRRDAADPRTARPGWNPLTLAVAAALWLAALPNWPLWRALLALPEMASGRGVVFLIGFGLMITALTTALLALLAWRTTIKWAIGVLLLIAAVSAHYMGSYGVVLDTTMIVNVVQTDPREVRELLSLRLLGSVLLLAGLPMLWVARAPLQRIGAWRQAGRNALGMAAGLAVLAVLMLALFADLSATMRNHRAIRYLINPLNSLYALVDLGVRAQARPAGPPTAIGADARILPRATGSKPPLLVLVIGETARADHFSLNGYARATNPELAARDVVSFENVMACGTSTAASLPCMFSRLGREAFDARSHHEENLLDLVARAGMAVLWVDNQSGCKGLCDRVAHAFAREPVAGVAPLPDALCDADECLDEALVHGLDARISALPTEARARGVLLVLHQMGSHGPAYYKRSPPQRKPFLPECTTSVLRECERTSVVNAYDNTIAYTDHVLAQTLAWLEQQRADFDPMLLYVSDHGESLGENNLYLHGLPYAIAPVEQKHVPMIVWFGMAQGTGSGAQLDCVRARRAEPLTHDHLFHSVLGLLGIRAGEYRSQLDAFAACRAP